MRRTMAEIVATRLAQLGCIGIILVILLVSFAMLFGPIGFSRIVQILLGGGWD